MCPAPLCPRPRPLDQTISLLSSDSFCWTEEVAWLRTPLRDRIHFSTRLWTKFSAPGEPRRLPTLASIARCAWAVDRLKQRSLRNACEHTEDRALGNVSGKPDPQALSVFDYEPLLAEDTSVKHRLGVTDELPGLLADMRQCIKDVVSGGAALRQSEFERSGVLGGRGLPLGRDNVACSILWASTLRAAERSQPVRARAPDRSRSRSGHVWFHPEGPRAPTGSSYRASRTMAGRPLQQVNRSGGPFDPAPATRG